MADQSVKKKFDTTKMSAEEVKNLGLEDARKPPGQSPGGVLHQQGGAGLSRAGRYPVGLAGLAVVVGLASWAYYRSLNPQQHPSGKSNQAMESNHPATAKSPSERH
ncbi:unnamed protein product [Sphagnum troendelagicum]|uniref:Uncharacterized protein n=1 Tax=Sphagnum troendelagicum TaxID=128251 RepID=A0ABP0UMH6_9BRYO